MKKIVREIVMLVMISIPYIYLFLVWENMPETIPTHFTINGEADDWSNKNVLLYWPGILCAGTYLLMLVIPLFDAKNKLKHMGEKYTILRLIFIFFFSVLSTYFIHVSNEGNLSAPNFLIAILGALFLFLGNYFQTIKPNYFIGIRTPWTLENEQVWRKTHRLSGKLWFIGGMIIIVLSFLVTNNNFLAIAFGCVLAVMVLVPIIYSYLESLKLKA